MHWKNFESATKTVSSPRNSISTRERAATFSRALIFWEGCVSPAKLSNFASDGTWKVISFTSVFEHLGIFVGVGGKHWWVSGNFGDSAVKSRWTIFTHLLFVVSEFHERVLLIAYNYFRGVDKILSNVVILQLSCLLFLYKNFQTNDKY